MEEFACDKRGKQFIICFALVIIWAIHLKGIAVARQQTVGSPGTRPLVASVRRKVVGMEGGADDRLLFAQRGKC